MPEPFSEADRIKILLWCDRHCCLCDKACGTNIVIHHIEQEGENLLDIDNAIPLCLDCHGKIKSYDPKHPVGISYKIKEIKARRDQIYEKYTRHLVPPIHLALTQKRGPRTFKLPFIGVNLSHLGDSLPVQIRVEAKVILGEKDLGLVNDKKGYYNGKTPWNINPRTIFFGGFSIPKEYVESGEELKIEIRITIIDQYGREHKLLPQCFRYVKELDGWNLEPRSFAEWT